MKPIDHLPSRREFVGTLTASAATLLAGISTSSFATPADQKLVADAEEWFKKVKGKHRIIYDAPEPHAGFPIIWSWAYYQTNNQTGSPDTDLTAMVVLRHNGIPIAMEDRLWEKYKFGEVFKIDDNNTKAAAVRNPYYDPQGSDFPLPGIDGVKKLQARGAMFCVCDLALTVYSGFVAKSMSLNPEEVKKDWVSGLLPGVQVVPSGVWAVGRAQEKGCGYCYAGG
jgi:intracellular sulfur oxidation DsrE/DsrF family protein